MFDVELEVRVEWPAVVTKLGEACRSSVQIAVREGAQEARRVHTYTDRTGDLTKSIAGIVTSYDRFGAIGQLFAKAKYASFVENGTAPHRIEPRRAKMLAWDDDGWAGTHFARGVNHPGTKEHPFMGPALQKAERVLERELGSQIARIADEVERT